MIAMSSCALIWGASGCGSAATARADRPRELSVQDFATSQALDSQNHRPAFTAKRDSIPSAATSVAPGGSVLVLGEGDSAAPWSAQNAPSTTTTTTTTTPPPEPPSGGDGRFTSLGASTPEPASPLPSTGAMVIDQMVGNINGKPLYASDFLEPFDARLRAEAARLEPREWIRSTTKLIQTSLVDHVRDELLLAEFYANLEPEQRAGVLAYIQRLRTSIISKNLGAEALAEERLLETEGVTLEEKVKQDSERALILEQLRREVASKVVISYRDIERYFENHPEEFNPLATSRLRVIRVSPDDAETVAVALLASEPFADVAERFTTYNAAEGGALVIVQSADGASPRFFGPDALNDIASALQEGETKGPIEFAEDQWWIHFEGIDRPAARSLYDAQEEIEQNLRNQRLREEEQRFFNELLKRARISDLEVMVQRIVEFAAVRYLPGAGE